MTVQPIVQYRGILTVSNQLARCLLFTLILQGCSDHTFEALGCEWKKPDGYINTVKSPGYVYIEPGSRKSAPFVRYYERDPGEMGLIQSSAKNGVLNLEYYKVPDDAQYLAGDRTIRVVRDGYPGRVVINEEELKTFLVGCNEDENIDIDKSGLW